MSEYDAADCAKATPLTPACIALVARSSSASEAGSLPAASRDFRGRIDETLPQTLLYPFAFTQGGGKAAADTPAGVTSVYGERAWGGVTSRHSSVQIKAKTEQGQRVRYIVNSQPVGELISPLESSSCVVPSAQTPSTEIESTGVMIPMITSDRVSSDGLTTQAAPLCDVAYTYTFTVTCHQKLTWAVTTDKPVVTYAVRNQLAAGEGGDDK